MKGVCRFIQKGFYWRKEKKMPGKHNFHQASFSSVIDKNVITSFYYFLAIAQFHHDVRVT